MSAPDPSQPDLAWRGYSGWAMLPSFVICVLITLALLTGGWFFEDVRGIGQEFGWLVYLEIAAAVWMVQLLRWLYRGASFVYRLTPAFLYVDFGWLYNPTPPVELARVTKVAWGSDLFGRLLGTGRVVIECEGRAPLTLTGVLRPAAFAEEIEATVKKRKTSAGT
jgi:uncharacterized membrane protein YdbT with pleckstrin-like domain